MSTDYNSAGECKTTRFSFDRVLVGSLLVFSGCFFMAWCLSHLARSVCSHDSVHVVSIAVPFALYGLGLSAIGIFFSYSGFRPSNLAFGCSNTPGSARVTREELE